METRHHLAALLLLTLPFTLGCPASPTPPKSIVHAAHAEHGPHDGELLAFDDGKYHVEVVSDDSSDKVTFYTLDNEAKGYVSVEVQEPTLHIEFDGDEKEFKLTAAPTDEDPEGKTTRFEITSHEIHEALASEARESAELTLTFDGKPLVGKYESHDHHHHHGHRHGDDAALDVLIWQNPDGAELGGCVIKLGQHGLTIRAGKELEPAVSITRDDKPVDRAEVYVSLLDADGTEIVAEQQTEFEPTTKEEPAHYAGAKLGVPADAEQVVLRYRVVLPDDGGSETYEFRVATEKDD
jgi:hypothetical protein